MSMTEKRLLFQWAAFLLSSRYFLTAKQLLVSRNQNIDSITINQNLIKIQGVLAGLIRAY